MCTVTIIPQGNGIRMACNRDESPLRQAALPPRLIALGERQAVMPIDLLSGGTWIAANDAGLIMTLLNYYAAPHDRNAPPPKRSRGTIIPGLLDAETLEEAFARTNAIVAVNFADFRLVLADRHEVAEVLLDAGVLTRRPPQRIEGPLFFTSSGLGDAVVGPPRRALFDEYFRAGTDWPAQQDAYHRHSWPERRHLSVCMRRPDARTVSYTVVDNGNGVHMTYHAAAPDQTADSADTEISLPAHA